MEDNKKENIIICNDTVYHDCGALLFKITPETVLVNFPAYCKKCKKEIKINLVNEKLVG